MFAPLQKRIADAVEKLEGQLVSRPYLLNGGDVADFEFCRSKTMV